ncbi:hypothetical protein D3OALGA1CA_1451 [Olavius algarvensis associated proteobacterium Delta 3]|nr:hypothetical protein D3OALGA1CA_1451 [Olavius algarvensis associated proteobacterium Delta 3]
MYAIYMPNMQRLSIIFNYIIFGILKIDAFVKKSPMFFDYIGWKEWRQLLD